MKFNKTYWHILFKHRNMFSMLYNPRKAFFKTTCFSGVNLILIKDRFELIKFHNGREYKEAFLHVFWVLYPLSKICKTYDVWLICFKSFSWSFSHCISYLSTPHPFLSSSTSLLAEFPPQGLCTSHSLLLELSSFRYLSAWFPKHISSSCQTQLNTKCNDTLKNV